MSKLRECQDSILPAVTEALSKYDVRLVIAVLGGHLGAVAASALAAGVERRLRRGGPGRHDELRVHAAREGAGGGVRRGRRSTREEAVNHEEAMVELAKEFELDDASFSLCENDPKCHFSPCKEYWTLRAQLLPLKSLDIVDLSAHVEVPTDILPDDDKARLDYPIFDGLMAYFPSALAEVARVSKIGNDQHNPGQPLHWARSKSTDHENKIARHLLESGTMDSKGVRHSARLAWRALALLQVELEREEGAPLPRNAKF
ncbi:MAG: dATP/dGTP diphosphohydrolase domain-containing protein [Steroidobacteraceae bacterium]